jgi:hypothetical protein
MRKWNISISLFWIRQPFQWPQISLTWRIIGELVSKFPSTDFSHYTCICYMHFIIRINFMSRWNINICRSCRLSKRFPSSLLALFTFMTIWCTECTEVILKPLEICYIKTCKTLQYFNIILHRRNKNCH